MATWSEQLIEKGRQQGLQLAFQEAFQLGYEEGYQIGRRQAFLELLPLMLERYFGAVDEETQERIRNASTDELRRWILNSRYAGRLEDVFRLQ